MTYSVEEMNLMCIFDHSSRTTLQKELSGALPYIDDTDMEELMRQCLSYLEQMRDEEFKEIVFEPALDDDGEWEAFLG
jgi:hypothetical protein